MKEIGKSRESDNVENRKKQEVRKCRKSKKVGNRKYQEIKKILGKSRISEKAGNKTNLNTKTVGNPKVGYQKKL